MENDKKLTKKDIISLILVLVAAPLTIYIGWTFGDRQYYIISVLIIIYSIIPFFFAFERRKPQARELVVIAVMCALAVASRAAFIWLPHFKPMTAIIMITGIALGAEAGFLTGAVSAFVSNFIFGQGVWTPWQMLSFGLAGFAAGLIFRNGVKSKTKLCIFGGLFVLCIVGPILDTCTLFTMTSNINAQSAAAVYMAGLPVNAIHAAATVITLLLIVPCPPIIGPV